MVDCLSEPTKKTPLYVGVFIRFWLFVLYLAGTKFCGLNLYPYTRYMPHWADPIATLKADVIVIFKSYFEGVWSYYR